MYDVLVRPPQLEAAVGVVHAVPELRFVLDCFGADRVMFGSDWPVCLVAAGYAEVLDLADQDLGALSPAERDDVFGGVATRIYDL